MSHSHLVLSSLWEFITAIRWFFTPNLFYLFYFTSRSSQGFGTRLRTRDWLWTNWKTSSLICCFWINCVFNRRQIISACNCFIELTVHNVLQPLSILYHQTSRHGITKILLEDILRSSGSFRLNTTKLVSKITFTSCFQIMHNTHSVCESSSKQ